MAQIVIEYTYEINPILLQCSEHRTIIFFFIIENGVKSPPSEWPRRCYSGPPSGEATVCRSTVRIVIYIFFLFIVFFLLLFFIGGVHADSPTTTPVRSARKKIHKKHDGRAGKDDVDIVLYRTMWEIIVRIVFVFTPLHSDTI